ncbi:hypothetical protein FRC03_008817 [Tulasnella sp. 419]|nr:hypothetical protein FRC03_008817 [Tulasnella sp. 419]
MIQQGEWPCWSHKLFLRLRILKLKTLRLRLSAPSMVWSTLKYMVVKPRLKSHHRDPLFSHRGDMFRCCLSTIRVMGTRATLQLPQDSMPPLRLTLSEHQHPDSVRAT